MKFHFYSEKESDSMKFQNFINNFPGFISVIDLELNYIEVNAKLASFYKMSREDFIGKKIGFRQSEFKIEFSDNIKSFIESGKPHGQFEITLQNEGESFIYLMNLSRYESDRVIIVGLDITDQKDLEQELEDKNTDLKKASTMAVLGQMAAGIAHEINNPLSIIYMLCQKVQTSLDTGAYTPEKLKESFVKISNTADRIKKIILGLKTMTRDGHSDPFEKTTTQQLICDSIDFCNHMIKLGQINLRLNLPKEEILVDCRTVQITQVIVNLLTNAIDAIANTEAPWIEVALKKITDDSLQITVTDSGKGIPFELQDKIMEPFFTTKPVGKGTGLGLSIIGGILSDHNGSLHIDNNCKNTRFVVTLPVAKAKTNLAA